MHAISQATEDPGAESLRIRRARAEDVPLVSALDAEVTGLAKPDYWRDVFERYGERRLDERFFLIAEIVGQDRRDPILGFIVGEVRAWEFGSQPCGWVFGFSVEPEARLKGVGTSLFDEIAAEFKRAGVDKMRTMVARDNHLHMTFFRSEGMMAGPYIQLEKDLD
jgi:ribosomal protein S18 acetylase RimI-like enzyme